MGRVRTKTVKRAAKVLLERHYQKLTSDFHINKRILSEVAKVPTKSLRNKIAGFATHLVKRIQKGPVKGISLKVQEEERERRLDWVPKESDIKIDRVNIDNETANMLKNRFGEKLFTNIEANLEVKAHEVKKDQRKGKKGGEKKDRQQRQKEPREGKEQKEEKPETEGQEKPEKQKRERRKGRDGQ